MDTSRTTGWLVLGLCTLTVIIVYTIPTLMLPVLFAEIAADLNLDIVQLGIAWGSISLSSIFVGLFGGALGDRFGSRRTLVFVCFFTGILGMLRGLASNYLLLVASFMIYSLIAPAIPPNLHKAGAHFFPKNRGISTTTISVGFAFALFIGARYTATWLSPLVGGWRNVLFFFGGFALLFSLIWALVPDNSLPQPSKQDRPFFETIFSSLQHILQIREIWIIGAGSALFWGCYKGFTGYTPVYLRDLGWDPQLADQALSNFFLASLFFAIPVTYLAERLGNRKPFLAISMFGIGTGVFLMGTGTEPLFPWFILGAGIMFDAFMGLHQAEILDLKDVSGYAGSALGSAVMFREIGGVLGPPIGNWMAQFNPNLAFFFWGGLGLIAGLIFLFWGLQANKSS